MVHLHIIICVMEAIVSMYGVRCVCMIVYVCVWVTGDSVWVTGDHVCG